MNQPLVSVIIPAFNAARTIRRAVDSVLAQTYCRFEILIVDDGSQDDLASALSSVAHRVRLIRQQNGGVASARNKGIDLCTGDLIAFLDADDYWEPDKLRTQVEPYLELPELGLSCSRYYQQEPGSTKREAMTFSSLVYDRLRILAGRNAFEFGTLAWTGTVMIPRSLIGRQRFESSFIPAEDRQFWIRMVEAAPVFCHSKPLATHVLEPGSLSRSNFERDYTNMIRVVEANSHLLGEQGVQEWVAKIYRRWSGTCMGSGNARAALRPAWQRLKQQPASVEAWWIAAKAMGLSLLRS